jgi:transcriptional regulator with XRE-family HTH domain
MSASRRRIRRVQITAERIVDRAGSEIREAREGAGIGLRDAAASVGLGYRTLARIERGEAPAVTVRQLCLAAESVGLELGARLYPGGDPVRDAAQIRLLGRLRACLPSGVPWRTEVPIPLPGDRRAIDAVAVLAEATVGFEAETRLADLQAVTRRVLLKKRDAGLDRLVLVVNDTRANRRALALHRDDLRASFPLDARPALRSLRLGAPPDEDAIVVL